MQNMSIIEDIYDPQKVDIDRLAELLGKLSPEQLEALEIRLNPEAMMQLQNSKRDLETGDTVSIDEW